MSFWAVAAVGWLAWLVLRAGEETRQAARVRLSTAGRTLAAGLSASALTMSGGLVPCADNPAGTPTGGADVPTQA